MAIEPAVPAFPRPELLVRFFTMPPDALVPLDEVAELLGTTAVTIRELLREEGAQPPNGPIRWSDAASYLFDAWPRARLLDALDDALGSGAAEIIPPDFQLTPVTWSIPSFILRAIEHQAAEHAHPGYARGLDDYVADLLYDAIDPATVEAFRQDSAFLRAFHYPAGD